MVGTERLKSGVALELEATWGTKAAFAEFMSPGLFIMAWLVVAAIAAVCTLMVVVLAMTRWRSSRVQLALSLATLALGLFFFYATSRANGFSLGMIVYLLPAPVGAFGIFGWIRSRYRKPPV